MSQNTQQYSKIGTAIQSSSDTCNVDPLAQVDTLKFVACPICRAMYVPASEQSTAKSTGLLETAFLGICRFCFRCQRPACPQCWNPVHHTCASCSEEARLPFRTPVPSLEGLVFLPSTSIHTRQENNLSFTCQRNGRFYTPETAPTRPAPQKAALQPKTIVSEPMTLDALPTLQAKPVLPTQTLREIEHYPTWLQEVLGQKGAEQAASPSAQKELSEHAAHIYMPAEPASLLTRAEPQHWLQMAPTAPQQAIPSEQPILFAPTSQAFPPVSPAGMSEHQSEIALQDDPGSDDISLFERIENVLIIITSILLLAVVLMIVLSIISAQVNTFFLHLLHIDIRTEIAYLLQLR